MAKLTPQQWERPKADYEIGGLKQAELVKKYGMGKATLSDKIRKEGWIQGKTEQTEQKKTNAIMALVETEQITEQLTITEQTVLDSKIEREIVFRLRNDSDMEQVRDKAIELLKSVNEVKDVKALMDTFRIQREAMLGKSPDTAVQINNNVEVKEGMGGFYADEASANA